MLRAFASRRNSSRSSIMRRVASFVAVVSAIATQPHCDATAFTLLSSCHFDISCARSGVARDQTRALPGERFGGHTQDCGGPCADHNLVLLHRMQLADAAGKRCIIGREGVAVGARQGIAHRLLHGSEWAVSVFIAAEQD